MRRAVIIDLVRTPFGRARENGALAVCHPVDLYAHILKALVKRTRIDPALVEDVITKDLHTYKMLFLRQESSLHDHV